MKLKSTERTYIKHCHTKGLFTLTGKGCITIFAIAIQYLRLTDKIEYSYQAPQLTKTLKFCFQFIIYYNSY